MSRPSKYTPELVDILCELVSSGMSVTRAVDAVGLSMSTYSEWNKDNPIFSARIKEARALGISALLSTIQCAARTGTWTAAAWLLERLEPETYGRQAAVVPQEDTSMNAFLAGMNQIINGGGIKSDEQPEQ
ncbi:MAG: terminase small subunit-like protein [Armatimonadota bacterium]